MNINKLYIWILFLAGSAMSLKAQNANIESDSVKTKKAWELGLGGSVFQFSRTSFSNFTKFDQGYQFDMRLSHAVWGGNIYVARELNSHFYVDLQGTVGLTKESISNSDKNKWLYMVGPGLQWRLGEYFNSKYIDPYFRTGINYMYKGFDINYTGKEGLNPDDMEWIMNNLKNKEGGDRKHLLPVSLGGGINAWLNDNIGIGVQADYLIMPYRNVANSLQGTVRLIWRIGGEPKKSASRTKYIERERIVEKIIEKPVIVEKAVEKIVEKDNEMLQEIFNNIYFEFDSHLLTTESEKLITQIATALKKDTSKKYLITGFTDSRGSAQYNLELSKKRAAEVVRALTFCGVPSSMLKSRGVSSKISYAKPNVSDNIRVGDRKVTIELISNMEYWNYLPNKNF